jgi:hypothetical protein
VARYFTNDSRLDEIGHHRRRKRADRSIHAAGVRGHYRGPGDKVAAPRAGRATNACQAWSTDWGLDETAVG